MNLSSYVPKANVDDITSDQGTGISTLDHLATTPGAMQSFIYPLLRLMML